MSSLKKYEYVIAIEQAGGISQAAEKLQIAQPTLSKYIKSLESELGIELFDRTSLPLKPTPAGELFIDTGIKMINLEKQFKKQLDEIKQNKNTLIRVGISPSRSPYILPSIIKRYRQENTYAQIVIEEKTTTELNTRLENGELDLIISINDEGTADFERVELFYEKVLLAYPKKGFSYDASISDILSTMPLISVGKGQAMWQTMKRLVSSLSLPEPSIECQSIESALSLARRGIGATLVPSYIYEFGTLEQNNLLNFIDISLGLENSTYPSFNRQVCLFYRKEQFLTEAEKCFINCVKEAIK